MLNIVNKIKAKVTQQDNEKISRGNFRLNRMLYTAMSLFGSKGVSLLVTLVSLPLTYNYLGEERYGMMATIVSLLAMLGFADLGLGLGLHNRVAEYEIRKDWEGLRKIISSTFYMLVLVAFLLFVFFIFIYSFVDWHNIFNVTSELAISESGPSILIFILIFTISLPFTIVQKLQSGFQEGYYNEFWRAGGNILGLLLLLLAVNVQAGVPYIILAIYGSNALFLILNYVRQFYFKRLFLSPRKSLIDFSKLRLLFKEGLFFFTLQVSAMLANTSDSIITAQYLGAEQVAIYSIGYRLMAILSMPVNILASTLLPAINDAFSINDVNWIKTFLLKAIIAVIGFSFVLALLNYFFGNWIISIWIDEKAKLPVLLLFSFSAYILYFNVNAILSNVTLSPKLISFVIKVYPLAAILAILLKLLLVQEYQIVGILWASMIAFTLVYFIPTFYKFKKLKLI